MHSTFECVNILSLHSLVYPRSAEPGGETLILCQVGKGVVAELHWLPWEPAAELVDALLHSSREHF